MPSKKKKNILESYINVLNGTSVSNSGTITSATSTAYTTTYTTNPTYTMYYDTSNTLTINVPEYVYTTTTIPTYTYATFVDTKSDIGYDFNFQMLFENDLIKINEKGEVLVDGKLELNPTKIGRALLQALEKYRQEDLNDPKEFFNKD